MTRATHAMNTTGLPSSARGFTVLELMIVVVILAVVATFAVPNMTNIILKHRVQDAATDLFTAMHTARSEALKRNVNINLRPNTSTDWTSGWKTRDSGGVILDQHQPVQRMSITYSGGMPVVYNSSGRITGAAPTWTLTASRGNYSCTYTVTADPSGRPYETATGVRGTNAAGGGSPSC